MRYENMKPDRLYVFWKYDTFPYCLGSELKKIEEGGKVKTVGYGGSLFMPLIILPYEEGININDRLAILTNEYDNELQSLKQKYKQAANELLPDVDL